MSDYAFQLLAIIMYMLAMVLIGWYAYKRTKNLSDYMLGGRDLGPAVTALSAGAADMSGWLLMGLPGVIYASGLVEAWIAIGLTIGAWLNWYLVAPRLRVYTQVSKNSITIPSFLDNRLRDGTKLLRIVSGIVILVFFTFYVSSGMVSGGKFFESSFGFDYHTGLLVVAIVTVGYTLFGGFLAVSYTDFLQGLIMFLALVLVPTIGIFMTGGIGETVDTIHAIKSDHFSLLATATIGGVVSSIAWGLGYFGQPHIIVRFMAIKSVSETKQARRIGISWMILSLGGAIGTAIVGLAYFQQHELIIDDPETIFIEMGQILFHPFIAGIMLAAILAAVMSTISSQLIVTSSALIEDMYKALFKKEATDKHYVTAGRLAVLVVSVVAAFLGWNPDNSILDLVGFAWAGFGAAFGPTILLALYWRKLTNSGALIGMVAGAVVSFIWGQSELLSNIVYEIVPGFFINLLLTVVVSLVTYKANPDIEKEFDETVELLKNESTSRKQ